MKKIKEKIFFEDLVGKKVSVLIDHARAPDGVFKESYVGVIVGEKDKFLVVQLDVFWDGKLEQIWIRKDQILSIWVYKDDIS